MKTQLALTALGLAACGTSTQAQGKENPAQQPNILFIQADQLNVNALSCYGGIVPTPNLDRLARGGALMRQAYVTRPTSSPCRASIVTGLHTHQHGVVNNIDPKNQKGLTEQDTTTEKLLHSSGYQTHHYGKWHVGDGPYSWFPDMYSYGDFCKENRASRASMRRTDTGEWMEYKGLAYPVELAPPIATQQEHFKNVWRKRAQDDITKIGRMRMGEEGWVDWATCERTIARLNTLKGSDKPFMVTASFIYPHDPNFVCSPHYDRFDPAVLPIPGTPFVEQRYTSEWSYQLAQGWGPDGVREFLRIYYGEVAYVDMLVGRLLETLEANGQLEHTMIVFVTDHGDMMGNHGMVWKTTTSFYQDVVHIPMIFYHPGSIKPATYDIPVSVVDFMPTFLSATGHAELLPAGRPGIDLMPWLTGKKRTKDFPRKYVVCERVSNNAKGERKVLPGVKAGLMITDTRWKYVVYTDSGFELLYDMGKDRYETRNLAADPASRKQLVRMRSALRDWLTETGWRGGYEFFDTLKEQGKIMR